VIELTETDSLTLAIRKGFAGISASGFLILGALDELEAKTNG
jgi:hypothetical protein